MKNSKNGTVVKKSITKIYFPWQLDKEEKWLEEMSKKGWHIKKHSFLKYEFAEGTPEEYIYCIDYKIRGKDNYGYIELFKELNWEFVSQCMDWYYFRTKNKGNKTPIYSDNSSKLEKYKQMFSVNIGLFAVLAFILLVYILDYAPSISKQEELITRKILLGFGLVLSIISVVLYGTWVYKLYKYISKLKERITEKIEE